MCLRTVMLLPQATVGQTGQFPNKSMFVIRVSLSVLLHGMPKADWISKSKISSI